MRKIFYIVAFLKTSSQSKDYHTPTKTFDNFVNTPSAMAQAWSMSQAAEVLYRESPHFEELNSGTSSFIAYMFTIAPWSKYTHTHTLDTHRNHRYLRVVIACLRSIKFLRALSSIIKSKLPVEVVRVGPPE